MESKRATETQIGGNHYREMAIQPSEFIQRNGLNWCEGNIIKYLCRHRNKNGAQDVQKAIHYAELLLEWEYSGMTKTAADYTPLSPSEAKSIADSISPPSLCVSCHRQCEDKYKLDMCECIGYLSNEGAEDVEQVKVDEWAEKDLCRKCVNNACYAAGKKLRTDFCVNYYDEFTMDAAPDRFASPPSLCGTCIRRGCPVDCAEHTTECGEYLPQGIGSEPAQSKQWTHEPEVVALSLALPSITVEGNLEEVRMKCEEEAKEWGQCNVGSVNGVVEAWDFVQARQTYSERGGDPISLRCGDIIGELQRMRKDNPEMVEAAKRAVLIKNACRTRPDGGTGYYAPEVCEKLILSGGREW